jgi:hypothetical protein
MKKPWDWIYPSTVSRLTSYNRVSGNTPVEAIRPKSKVGDALSVWAAFISVPQVQPMPP